MQGTFDFDPRTKVRSTDPATSRTAAFSNLPLKNTQRRILLEIHRNHPFGLTDDELSQLTPMGLNSLTTRRSELYQGGWLEDTGLTRPTRKGVHAVVWGITKKGLNADRQ